jgi:hypothetical protein
MEVVIDFETLKGINDETMVKEFSLASDNVAESFHFTIPTKWPLTAMRMKELTGPTDTSHMKSCLECRVKR